jgi:hypothetical protein
LSPEQAAFEAFARQLQEYGIVDYDPIAKANEIPGWLGGPQWAYTQFATNPGYLADLRTKLKFAQEQKKTLDSVAAKVDEQTKAASAITANYEESQRSRMMASVPYTKGGTIRTSPKGVQSPMLTSPLAFSGARKTLVGV